MHYQTDLNDRPFQAILNGSKKVEGRTITSWEMLPLKNLKVGDLITFINNSSNEKLTVKVRFIHHYTNVKTMLEQEKIEDVLSSFPKTIKAGVASYNSITEYKDAIPKYGIYAIGVEVPDL